MRQALPTVVPFSTGDEQFQSPLSWELVGKNLFAMGLQGPVFLLLTLLLQHRTYLLPRSALGSLESGTRSNDLGGSLGLGTREVTIGVLGVWMRKCSHGDEIGEGYKMKRSPGEEAGGGKCGLLLSYSLYMSP